MTEEKPVVAFLGPKASYTHQATLDSFPGCQYTLSPQITIEDVFASVQDNTASRGVVPFENSTNGSVVFTLDLFADLNARYPDILVCGEAYISVSHCLLGRHTEALSRSTHQLPSIIESPTSSGAATPTANIPNPGIPRTKPTQEIGHIKKLYSHPQAWGQCKSFLSTYLKGVERQDVSSTSRAAELVAADETGTSAAISSIIAAKIHNLDILARGIEDRSDNTTRFFIIKRASPPSSLSSSHPQTTAPSSSAESKNGKEKPWKSLISFTVHHSNPGALAHCLAVFEPFKLNLTSINTRPSGVAPWNYIFFVEIDGRREEGGEGAVNAALQDLAKVSRGWRWLGSWESRLK
ncbi:PDT-domain-containing protein [Zopfia rhizophila CBS 207.26]|uniref:prephenate dehydratase n=1 Tax=Zopfia rhizophila CBS 207.26 TaxID=1314779 RepID=A0A6A6DY07_9PEZI|nr:PDT-domain-containing protein [Zopfia rhizophila CBS 207.26]